MSKKIIILSIFIAVSILLSGCITDKNNGTKVNETKTIDSDIIPTINLPSGFTYMGVHDTNDTFGNFSENATEGIYRTDRGEDIYIRVFQTEKPEELLEEYKAEWLSTRAFERAKNASFDPFTSITFNGHKATQVMYYSLTTPGQTIQKYDVIWTINNSMIKVGSSTDAQKVIDLATATNN